MNVKTISNILIGFRYLLFAGFNCQINLQATRHEISEAKKEDLCQFAHLFHSNHPHNQICDQHYKFQQVASQQI